MQVTPDRPEPVLIMQRHRYRDVLDALPRCGLAVLTVTRETPGPGYLSIAIGERDPG